MQTFASISRGVARIAFRGGSPQRIPYSSRLTVGTLLALLALAVATQVYVFRSDLVGICLYLFTGFTGLYLGTALLSRRTAPARLRSSLQATVLLLAAAHALLLLTAPLAAALRWLPYVVAGMLAGISVAGMINCVQFALGRSRTAAAGVTLGFVLTVAGFYTIMRRLLAVAMG